MPDINIDDGLHTITIAGDEYHVDLIEVHTRISALAERHKDAKGYPHLADFAAHMQETYGMTLRSAQAEALWQRVVVEVNRQKKDYVDEVNSLSSTGSTPVPDPVEEE